MRFLPAVLLSLCLLCTPICAGASFEGVIYQIFPGSFADANGDGQVTPADALRVMQYTAGWSVTINKVNADMDANGTVNLTDALLIFQTAAGN